MTDDTPRTPAAPLALYPLAAVLPVVAAAVLVWSYPAIPEVYPVHWDAAGGPDRFMDKSWYGVLMLPLMTLVLVFLLSATGLMQHFGRRPYPTTDVPGEGVALPWSDSLNTRVHYIMGTMNRWLAWMTLGISLGMSMLSLAATVPAFSGWMTAGLIVTLGSAALGVAAAVATVVRNPAALRTIVPDAAELERMRLLRDTANYRSTHRVGGLFYSNPADPMLMVPAQHQDGNINFNVAHAPARRFWVVLLGSLVLLVLIPLLSSL